MQTLANIKITQLILLLLCVVSCPAQNVQMAVLYNFALTNDLDGAYPQTSLISGNNGTLYGTTVGGGDAEGGGGDGTVFKINIDGSGYTILYRFNGHPTDGQNPHGKLLLGNDGVLYGTTLYGGTNAVGIIFRLNTNGTGYSIIHTFKDNGADAAYPYGGLVQGNDGMIYGTTFLGGQNYSGTVFKINQNGTIFSVIKNFSYGVDAGSKAGLVFDTNGVLYGTTFAGGGNGTLFKMNTNGSGYTQLHTFTNSPDGSQPFGELTIGKDGALYGTTTRGGIAAGSPNAQGYGTVFKVNTDGSAYKILYSFTNIPDGNYPQGRLLQGDDDTIYGTTQLGGVYYNQINPGLGEGEGTVFKINADGSGYSVLHNFKRNVNGSVPFGGLVQGNDGALYCAASQGLNAYGGICRFIIGPNLGSALSSNGSPQITLTGLAGQNCQIQTSSNLTTWITLTNLVINTNGAAQFTDSAATNFNQRYFRAVTQ